MSKTVPSPSNLARELLTCGMLAGLVFVGLGVLQIVMRPEYDPTRHELSLLANGEMGWIQTANFIITGLLVLATAMGLRHVLRGQRGGKWAPILLGLYGLGLIGASIFPADPMNGFPVGTPDGPPVHPTTAGLLHVVTAGIGFIGLVSACFVMASHFKAGKAKAWARFSTITGIVFLGAFMGVASGGKLTGAALATVTLLFTGAVLLAWLWLGLVSRKFKGEVKPG